MLVLKNLQMCAFIQSDCIIYDLALQQNQECVGKTVPDCQEVCQADRLLCPHAQGRQQGILGGP